METDKRLFSLDALRGFDMMFIMGLSGLLAALAKLGGPSWAWLGDQMKHVEWEGLAHHDTIFSLFLFLAGVSWPFSLSAQEERGRSRFRIALRVLCRIVTLIALGLVFNGLLGMKFAKLRYPSVLAFIGVGWGVAALLRLFVRKVWVRALVVVGLAVGYWSILNFLGAPDAQPGLATFSYKGNFPGYVDRLLWGRKHMYGFTDPEGLVSMMCGAVTASLGVFAGDLVRAPRFSGGRKALLLVAYAAGLLALGFACQPWCPVIKKLWTPTFALFTGAYSAAMFALFYWLCDVLKWRKWAFVFTVVGMNSITIYLAQKLIPFKSIADNVFGGAIRLCAKDWRPALMELAYIVVCWLFLWFLYRKKAFLKV